MQLLFESFRSYALLTEKQLLIEGRIADAAKKYPELAKKREELDGGSLLDILIAADPSGNQKYLMGAARIVRGSLDNAERQDYEPFWGKQWPEDGGDNLYSPWGQAKNIADLLPKYHKAMPFIRGQDEPFRDINNIKTYATLNGVVKGAENLKQAREEEKEAKKRESYEAKQNSIVVDDNDHHMMIRPLSAHASCYFGQSTQWCISATRSENYFDQYTGQGQAFYFLLAKNKDVDSVYKKIAIVVDKEGDVSEYYDSEDDSMTVRQFRDAIRQTIVGSTASGEMMSLEEDEPYKKEVILKGLEPFKGIGQFDYDKNDDIRDIIGLFDDTVVSGYTMNLEEMAMENARENPPGPGIEDYQKLLDEYDFTHMYVSIDDPSETGASQMAWQYSFGVDVGDIVDKNTQRLKWKVAKDDLEAREDEIFEIVRDVLHDNNVYPEGLEKDWGSDLIFNASSEYGSGDTDEFERFLEETQTEDSELSESVPSDILEKLLEAGFLGRDKREEEYWPDPEMLKKQQTLPFQESKRTKIKVRIIRG